MGQSSKLLFKIEPVCVVHRRQNECEICGRDYAHDQDTRYCSKECGAVLAMRDREFYAQEGKHNSEIRGIVKELDRQYKEALDGPI